MAGVKLKIAIFGTHGVGKTTLSFALASHYKREGKNVKIIQEVARACPFPLNGEMTDKTALWIYHEHSKKELEALRTHDIVICDRTSFDSFVYAKCLKIQGLDLLHDAALADIINYDKLIFVRPMITKPPLEDGVRCVDLVFQMEIDDIFEETIALFDHISVNQSEIFDKDQTWKKYCL